MVLLAGNIQIDQLGNAMMRVEIQTVDRQGHWATVKTETFDDPPALPSVAAKMAVDGWLLTNSRSVDDPTEVRAVVWGSWYGGPADIKDADTIDYGTPGMLRNARGSHS